MTDMIVETIVGVLLGTLGIIILIGKGDKLIAGYNTASEAEKARVHIKRLRLLLGVTMLLLAVMVPLTLGRHTTESLGMFLAFTMILMIVVLILANTWAKKKKK